MNRITTRRWVSFTLAVSMTLFALALPKPAKAEVVQNIVVPFSQDVDIPCANGGAGETVTISGNLHILITFSISANGGVRAKTHFQPQGATGVGAITGDIYRATGVTQFQFNSHVGYEETFVNNFRIIGPGPGNNFLAHTTAHLTINANGDVTAFVEHFSVDCK
jgi:hypothetical protein